MKKVLAAVILALCLLSSWCHADINVTKLSEADIAAVKKILAAMDPVITEKKRACLTPALTFDELRAPLDKDDGLFLDRFMAIDLGSLDIKIPYRGFGGRTPDLVPVKNQAYMTKSGKLALDAQFLPKSVYSAYIKMMKAMKDDIGRTLLIESGYRSPAYQLYLFLFYLKNHGYSVKETARFVAWPGYSEHGSPEHQAVDFINKNGINGEDDPEKFERLPEYKWLRKHAREYGFVLSYPRSSGMTFEPWHWRREKPVPLSVKKKNIPR
jgi:D-alanyl-D-alanine carboxypeptidase